MTGDHVGRLLQPNYLKPPALLLVSHLSFHISYFDAMNLDLTGKYALVGGASKGIGRAVAEELALLGVNVIVMARSQDLLQQAVAALPNNGTQKHHYIVADNSQPQALREAVVTFMQEHNLFTIHILVNNTGGPAGGTAIDAKPEEFVSAFTNHLLCNQHLAQILVPGMKAAGFGRIINIISTSVKQPIPGLGVSNSIRGAVANWSKTLSLELGQYGITVNNVLPGFTETERLESIIANKASKTGNDEAAIIEQMKQETPVRRFATANEVAAAAAFLASPAAAYVNGINLPVDGGRTASL